MSVRQEGTRGHRKVRIGIVCSDKRDKTVTVEVTRRVKHPKYKKYITRRKKYHAHDENNACRVGDKVKIIETRPLSKQKRWRVAETLEKAPIV
ncbi:MAG: 30S ribosomal protein S17 [Deltaproteobacteria bacterium]|nr:MAG: 30S ribosomal protein S17 [Deltaproteobacteria bacterium]